jgi:hypothetical protein
MHVMQQAPVKVPVMLSKRLCNKLTCTQSCHYSRTAEGAAAKGVDGGPAPGGSPGCYLQPVCWPTNAAVYT